MRGPSVAFAALLASLLAASPGAAPGAYVLEDRILALLPEERAVLLNASDFRLEARYVLVGAERPPPATFVWERCAYDIIQGCGPWTFHRAAAVDCSGVVRAQGLDPFGGGYFERVVLVNGPAPLLALVEAPPGPPEAAPTVPWPPAPC